MILHSAAYAYAYPNFTIENLDLTTVKTDYTPAVCVLKNILGRGVGIAMSDYLKPKIGTFKSTADNPLYVLNNAPQWDNTIKGTNDYNPALHFYKNILPNAFDNKDFAHLVLPEVRFERIDENEVKYKNYSFDFLLPQANLAIEIDGAQHQSGSEYQNDKQKTQWAQSHNISLVRLPVKCINNSSTLDVLKQALSNAKLPNYAQDLDNYIEDLKSQYIIRLQFLTLDLLQCGKLNLNDKTWHFNIKTPDNIGIDTSQMLQYALDDIAIWLDNILNLQGIKFTMPNIVINSNNDDCINISISVLDKYDDSKCDNCYIIRNDYFEYSYADSINYCQKNYFAVSVANRIDYKNVNEDNLAFLLKNIFGYSFRDGQYGIVKHILEGNNTVGILPTSAGKSLCYQIASVLQPCINFCVCPIVSLMADQYRNVKHFGFNNTAYINSTVNNIDCKLTNFAQGKYLITWISPERFQTPSFRQCLQSVYANKAGLIATIDEVHCLSEWGHDFRISYLCLIKTIRTYCPNVRLLGLTATASPAVKNDLLVEMDLSADDIKTRVDMDRANLIFSVHKVDSPHSKYQALEKIISAEKTMRGNDTVVFTKTVNFDNESNFGCKNLAQKFANSNYYSGGKDSRTAEQKDSTIQDFIDSKYHLMFATKAFGMGIDKPNIRATVHYGMPPSLESLYQEAGRAGRDNAPANCHIILYKNNNVTLQDVDNYLSDKTPLKDFDSKKNNAHSGDIANCLYFFKQNNLPFDVQIKFIKYIYTLIKGHKLISSNAYSHIDFISQVAQDDYALKKLYLEHFENQLDLALYRLYILGIVTDWEIDYRAGTYFVKTNDAVKTSDKQQSLKVINEYLLNYFRRREPNFSLDGSSYIETKIATCLKGDTLENYLTAILEFSYYKFSLSALRNIYEVYELCDTFTSSDNFKDIINLKFNVSEGVERTFFEIIKNDSKYNYWFDIMDNANVQLLNRYLNDYQLNTGLNYASGMLALVNNNFDTVYGRDRFVMAINNIAKYDDNAKRNIIIQSCKFLSGADMQIKCKFAECILNNNICSADYLYSLLADDYSLSIIIFGVADAVNNTGGKIR